MTNAPAVPGIPGDLLDRPGVLRMLLDEVADLVWCYRLRPTRGFLFVSASATAMTGYTPDEHYADPDLGRRIVHPADRALLAALAARRDDAAEPVELRWIHRDGSVLWTEQRVRPVRDAGGAVVALVGVARDVSARKRAEQLTHAHLAALAASASAVAVVSPRGRIEWVNAAFGELTGYAGDDAVGRPISVLNSGRQGEDFYRRLWARVLAGDTWSGELWNRRRDGTIYRERQVVTPVRGADGAVSCLVAVKDEVREHDTGGAGRDALTGAWTRPRFLAELERAMAGGVTGTVALLDLDRLEAVNRSAGAMAGDLVLAALGAAVRDLVPARATAGRLGDDEIAVLLPGAGPADAEALCEELLLRLAGSVGRVGGARVSASAGVAELYGSAATVLRTAERALAEAKAQGGGRVAVADGHEREWADDAALATTARRVQVALAGGGIDLDLQPIVPLHGTRPWAHAALMRLPRDDGDRSTAGHVMDAADRFGLAARIDHRIITRALALLAGHPGLDLFVTLSAAGLHDAELMDHLAAQVPAQGLDGGRLTLELAEPALMRSADHSLACMARLQALGVRFALHDFGAGVTSLAALRRLPVDVVKLGGALVCTVDGDPESRTVVEALARLARGLGRRVVAEQVETAAVESVLAGLGVELGQGARWALPRPPAQALTAHPPGDHGRR